jgi:hypothetical protein
LEPEVEEGIAADDCDEDSGGDEPAQNEPTPSNQVPKLVEIWIISSSGKLCFSSC